MWAALKHLDLIKEFLNSALSEDRRKPKHIQRQN